MITIPQDLLFTYNSFVLTILCISQIFLIIQIAAATRRDRTLREQELQALRKRLRSEAAISTNGLTDEHPRSSDKIPTVNNQ